jgi:hypothetical protein
MPEHDISEMKLQNNMEMSRPADDCRGVNETCCMGVPAPFKSFLLLFVMSSPNALLGPSVCFAGVAKALNKSISSRCEFCIEKRISTCKGFSSKNALPGNAAFMSLEAHVRRCLLNAQKTRNTASHFKVTFGRDAFPGNTGHAISAGQMHSDRRRRRRKGREAQDVSEVAEDVAEDVATGGECGEIAGAGHGMRTGWRLCVGTELWMATVIGPLKLHKQCMKVKCSSN